MRTHRPLPTRDGNGAAAGKPAAATKEPPKALPAKVQQQLEKLVSLKDAGILSDAEFEAARKRIVANG